jgi:uncharacterized protein YkwD
MIYTRVQRIICLLVTLTGLVLSVSPAAASETVIPPQFIHDGLTFTQPLSYSDKTFIMTVHITFEEGDIIEVTEPMDNPQASEAVLAEDIISPTPKKPVLSPETLPTLAEVLAAETENEVTPTPLPTKTPTPQPKNDQPQTETPTPATANLPSYATNGSLNADVLFSMANQKRAEAGLSAFEKHPDVCAVAESRKPEIENEVYGSSSIHAGFRARSLPFRATENMISQQTEDQAMSWWMNSSIHRAAILGNAKYACVACQNKTCAMIFSSLDPK